MADRSELDQALLRTLLDRELESFRENLEHENPGLSKGEMDRYMRAARKFASHLVGARPRTRGRQGRAPRKN